MSRTLRALPVGRHRRTVKMYKVGVHPNLLNHRRMSFFTSGISFSKRRYTHLAIERMQAQGGVFVEDKWGWRNVNSFCYLETEEEVREYLTEEILRYTRKNRTSYRQRMSAVRHAKRHANKQTRAKANQALLHDIYAHHSEQDE